MDRLHEGTGSLVVSYPVICPNFMSGSTTVFTNLLKYSIELKFLSNNELIRQNICMINFFYISLQRRHYITTTKKW